MKLIYLLSILSLLGCKNNTENENPSFDSSIYQKPKDKSLQRTAQDIINELIPNGLENICIGRMVILTISATSKTGKQFTPRAMGLIIDKNHILTVAHAIFNDYTVNGIEAICNYRVDQTRIKSKYIHINIQSDDYKKALKESLYNYKVKCSDFIVLPVKEDLLTEISDFEISDMEKKDTLFAVGANEVNMFHTVPIVPILKTIENECHLVYFYGLAQNGFSGSPVYNKNGNVVGIIQGGFETYPVNKFTEYLNNKFITKNVFDEIKKTYETGGKVGLFISMESLKGKLTNY